MMAESLDSRKFERKAVFDVPLPIRRAQRDATTAAEETTERDVQTAPDTMAFALMTKRGNRQQVRCTLKSISNSFTLIERIISSLLTECYDIDAHNRIALGFPLCHLDEIPTGR